jgi:hypothetical protein
MVDTHMKLRMIQALFSSLNQIHFIPRLLSLRLVSFCVLLVHVQ